MASVTIKAHYPEGKVSKDDSSLSSPLLNESKGSSLDYEAQGEPKTAYGVPLPVVSGAAYCVASSAMILLNKAVLSSFGFREPLCILMVQCVFSVFLTLLTAALQLMPLEAFNFGIVQLWLPVNIIFVAMIVTSFFSLTDLGVPMATVLKNLTNLFTIIGDWWLYGHVYGWGVWTALALVAASAFCGAATDIEFNAHGYAWQLVNCLLTAAYSLHLRGVIDKTAALTSDGQRLSEFSMVFYNNLLSLPFIAVLIWSFGEIDTVMMEPALRNPVFIATVMASAFLGFSINFASLWFLSTTTPTTYSLVGSLNKLPVAIIGLLAFSTSWTVPNLASIFVGLAAGIVFVHAKQSEAR